MVLDVILEILFFVPLILYWLTFLTKEDYFGHDSLGFFYKLILFSGILYILWGIFVSQSYYSLFNILIILILLLHLNHIAKGYFYRFSLFIVEFSCSLMFVTFAFALNLSSTEQMFGYINIGLAIGDYGVVEIKKKTQKTRFLKHQYHIEEVEMARIELITRFSTLLSYLSSDRREVLFTILRQEPQKWMNLPQNIQEMYLKTLLKQDTFSPKKL
jgi:hypothetical protein